MIELGDAIGDFDAGRFAYMVVYSTHSKTPVSIPVTVVRHRHEPRVPHQHKERWFVSVRLPWGELVECDPNDLFEGPGTRD